MPMLPGATVSDVNPAGPPGAYERIDASPVAFGATVGEAMAGLGEHVRQITNETNVDAANNAFEQSKRAMLFGPDGFYTKNGADAVTAMQPTAAAIEDLRQQTRDNLGNGAQQRMFDYISRNSTRRDLDSMSSHAATQGQVYQKDVATSAITNAVTDSGNYWNDDQRFVESLGNIKMQAAKLAQLQGITGSPDAVKAQENHYVGEAWQARIKSVMAADPDLARQMFDQNADQIDAPHRAAIDAELVNRSYASMMKQLTAESRAANLATQQLRDRQTFNESSLLATITAGNDVKPEELTDLVASQGLSATGYEAIMHAREGNDDPHATLDAWRGANDGSLSADGINKLLIAHSISGKTAVDLQRAISATSNPIERSYFDQLKTVLGGNAIEKGMVDLTNEHGRLQAARWTQAQGEWTNRVQMNHEDPAKVMVDMQQRYQPQAVVPTWLPVPRMGVISNLEDAKTVGARTLAAHNAGTMSNEQYQTEAKTIMQYQQFYQQQQDHLRARQPNKPAAGGDNATVRGVTASE